MTVQDQIKEFETELEKFYHCVENIPDDLFQNKIGNWTVRDIVAHLVGWNLYIIQGSKQVLKGETPFYDSDPGENWNKVNADLIARHNTTDKKKILQELKQTGAEVKAFLNQVRAEDWNRDFGVREKGKVVTVQTTLDGLIEDYPHHAKQIADWYNKQS